MKTFLHVAITIVITVTVAIVTKEPARWGICFAMFAICVCFPDILKMIRKPSK